MSANRSEGVRLSLDFSHFLTGVTGSFDCRNWLRFQEVSSRLYALLGSEFLGSSGFLFDTIQSLLYCRLGACPAELLIPPAISLGIDA